MSESGSAAGANRPTETVDDGSGHEIEHFKPVGTVFLLATAELAGYVTHFHPSFRAVTGSPADIDRAAASYGVYYRAGPPDDDGFYTVDHTASLMGIGPDGALRVLWPSGVGPEALAADLREMLS